MILSAVYPDVDELGGATCSQDDRYEPTRDADGNAPSPKAANPVANADDRGRGRLQLCAGGVEFTSQALPPLTCLRSCRSFPTSAAEEERVCNLP